MARNVSGAPTLRPANVPAERAGIVAGRRHQRQAPRRHARPSVGRRESVRQRDAIRMAVGKHLFRLVRVDDHADCLHHNPAGLFDGGGERHPVTRAIAGRAVGLMPPEETQT
jgi:hypothetical protein